MKFHTVIIIYNPNSTGDSEHNAKDLKAKLKDAGFKHTIKLIGTKFAGHAEEIANEYSERDDVLIVSSSGDGGYNEVVNGVLMQNGKAAVAVLPSGNANDHATSLHTDSFIENIANSKTLDIDCLKVTSMISGKPWQRYAHSYVGFGMTPAIGKLLTQERPGVLMEKWYVLRHVFSLRHVSLRIDGKRRRYTNLVVATISKMSKVVKLDEASSVTDGKLEVYSTRYVNKFKAILTIIGVGLSGIASESSRKKLTVETVRRTLIQLDGEVVTIDAGVAMTIECQPRCLRTVV